MESKTAIETIIQCIDQDIIDYNKEQKSDRESGYDDEAVRTGKIITGLQLARTYCVSAKKEESFYLNSNRKLREALQLAVLHMENGIMDDEPLILTITDHFKQTLKETEV